MLAIDPWSVGRRMLYIYNYLYIIIILNFSKIAKMMIFRN